MTFGQYIDTGFLIAGSLILAITLLQAMWYLIGYVFLGGDDAERAHMRRGLFNTTLNLMFIMIFWALFSLIGTFIGL